MEEREIGGAVLSRSRERGERKVGFGVRVAPLALIQSSWMWRQGRVSDTADNFDVVPGLRP